MMGWLYQWSGLRQGERPFATASPGMNDIQHDEEHREERTEAILIAGAALLMLCVSILLIAFALIARQERIDRRHGSAPALETMGALGIGEHGARLIEQRSRDLLVDRRR